MHAQGKFPCLLDLSQEHEQNQRCFILGLQAHIFACFANEAIFWPFEMAYNVCAKGAELNYL